MRAYIIWLVRFHWWEFLCNDKSMSIKLFHQTHIFQLRDNLVQEAESKFICVGSRKQLKILYMKQKMDYIKT